MIPISLSLSGFLSYRESVEIDFSSFDLACIAGANGAGKSSILDGITWALFGQARKRDESLINTQSDVAEVDFTFHYEINIYRVQRKNPRGKTKVLEFYILQKGGENPQTISPPASLSIPDSASWKPLTERTLRDTQARIEETLSLDYETFVNAAFFLQGKADQFTQQRPGDRKRILASILGLEIWETYRQRTLERRKSVEADAAILDGRLSEINVELAQEEERKARLEELKNELERLEKARAAQENHMENIKNIVASLEEQRKWVDSTSKGLAASYRKLEGLQTQLDERQKEKQVHTQIIERAQQIEAAYTAWKESQIELERWESIAEKFREHEKRRLEPLNEIHTGRIRLEKEMEDLNSQQADLKTQLASLPGLKSELEEIHGAIKRVQEQFEQRKNLENELQSAIKGQAEARAENPRLKSEMDELKARIDQLDKAKGAVCPTCGQPLNPQERDDLVVELTKTGKEMAEKYRANRKMLSQADELVARLQKHIRDLSSLDEVYRDHTRTADRISAQIEKIESQKETWEKQGARRMKEIMKDLKEGNYAHQARTALAEIDAELKAIGYDAAAHDKARQTEREGRKTDEELRALERAKASLQPLDREINNLQKQINDLKEEIKGQEEEYQEHQDALAKAEGQAPDLKDAQRELLDLQEAENQLRLEVGAAQQKVDVLEDQRKRRRSYQNDREMLAKKISLYKQLERAFSKNGVPALLIEQALPQIETSANETLDRLTMGGMSVRFLTQRELKTREDLKETLDIQIRDSAGTRDYEMFSGGEAFRVNFAIRLALSEVLAQRAGARIQTLVIDEGFGSQDAMGRQRLIEAINAVRQDFAKILVITHIEELKDAFPRRIEVEKTERGSQVRLI